MKPILFPNKKKDLSQQLLSYKNKEIVIVSAFVSGIKDHLIKLIKANKFVRLYTGVLMGFNNPKELLELSEIAKDSKYKKKFCFGVNFDESTSLHWKVYLISPDEVLIGSSNYTNVGIHQDRDIVLGIHDEEVFGKLYSHTLKTEEYTKATDTLFEQKLREYELNYEKKHLKDSKNEINKRFPLFVWDKEIDNKEKKEILNKLNVQGQTLSKSIDGSSGEIKNKDIRDYFSYDKGAHDFREGDWVIATKSNGAYLDFYQFDRIFSDKETTYAISLKKKRYNRPVVLDENMKRKIREIITLEDFDDDFIASSDFLD